MLHLARQSNVAASNRANASKVSVAAPDRRESAGLARRGTITIIANTRATNRFWRA
jgi:hypothetical protein